MKKQRNIIIAALLVAAFTSCKSEFFLAGTYLDKFERGSDDAVECIYVSMPQELIHTNSSLNDIAGFMFMSEYEQDSVIAAKTAILDKVDDSIFLSQFASYFLYTLSRSNIPVVVVVDPAALPVADANHLVVDLAQIELEEYLEPQRSDFTTRKGYYYFYDYDMRHLNVNLWLRFDASDTAELFYYSMGEEEDFHGTVVSLDDGTASMKCSFHRIDVNSAYSLARNIGYQTAVLYVERAITDHIRRVNGTNNYYFLYNPANNMFDDVIYYDEGVSTSFIPVK